MLPASKRFKKKDFDVFKKSNKKTFSSRYFNLSFCKTEFKDNHLAVVVSVAVAKKASKRNKLKRRVRVVLSDMAKSIKNGVDVVIYTKKGSADLPFKEIEKQIVNLFKKTNLLKK